MICKQILIKNLMLLLLLWMWLLLVQLVNYYSASTTSIMLMEVLDGWER